MVDATRILEAALGNGIKDIEENERQTSVLQRRCVRAARDLPAGTVVTREDLVVLRPAPVGSTPAQDVLAVVGSKADRDLVAGEELVS
jgi:N-acetylneuraminate synthase